MTLSTCLPARIGLAALRAGLFLAAAMASAPAQAAEFEASALLAVGSPEWLARRGWSHAFLTVSDEGPVQKCLGLMVREADGGAWSLRRLGARQRGGASDDAEALARHGGWIYVIGSHCGPKGGPLRQERHFVARLAETDLEAAPDGEPLAVTVASTGFRLHRLLNDALRQSGIELLPRKDREAAAFIDAARRTADPAAAQIAEGDRALNIEGAAFEPGGALLLGLRYPPSAEGHPILVRIEHVAALFDAGAGALSVSGVWTLDNVGDRAAPAGVRALAFHGGAFHVLTGQLESKRRKSALLEDHPEGDRARSAHHVLDWPQPPGPAAARRVHDFADAGDVEGIAFDPAGRPHYIRDDRGARPFTVATRTDPSR
ncbi:MAG: hypothetical protein JXQ29_15525 [Planctomycetes bacterium]|nr:hypothetical protein [Planctomycetota bacterium]